MDNDALQRSKALQILERANALVPDEVLGAYDSLGLLMDIETADDVFQIDFDRWLKSSKADFLHDFLGIIAHIDRQRKSDSQADKEMFGSWVPRFAKNQ